MWHAVRQIQKERTVFVCRDEVDGPVGIPPRHGTLIDGQFNDLFVLHQRRVPVRHGALLVLPQIVRRNLRLAFVVRVIHVIGVWNTQIGVEPVLLWQRFRMVPQVPFSETCRRVPLSLQMVRDRMFAGVQPFGRRGEQDVLMHSHPFRIAPGQQRGARRRAHRRRDHEIREPPAFCRHPIDVGGFDLGRPEATQVSVPLVVGKDDDKVRLGIGGGLNQARQKARQKNERASEQVGIHEDRSGTRLGGAKKRAAALAAAR